MSRIIEPGPVELARYARQLEAERDDLRRMLENVNDPNVDWSLMAKLVFDVEAERDAEKARADSLQHLQRITQAKLEEARRGVAGATEIIDRLTRMVRFEPVDGSPQQPTPAHEWESFDD